MIIFMYWMYEILKHDYNKHVEMERVAFWVPADHLKRSRHKYLVTPFRM